MKDGARRRSGYGSPIGLTRKNNGEDAGGLDRKKCGYQRWLEHGELVALAHLLLLLLSMQQMSNDLYAGPSSCARCLESLVL